MRKWQPLAAPDDPGTWYDLDGFVPTARGSYETADFLTGTDYTATGAGSVIYAFCANTLSSRREYVVDTIKIWEFSGSALTDRTGGVTIGSRPFMSQYGDVTVCTMGTANPTVKSTGGNFSALAGSPQGEIVLPVANALLYLNTNTSSDGWAASDIGDYTNYTTGESASGRLIQTPGSIVAGVAYTDYAIVFKQNAIYRIRYVGGTIKWATELLWAGIGCSSVSPNTEKYSACAGAAGILFPCKQVNRTASGQTSNFHYLFDGASKPRRVNLLQPTIQGFITYNPLADVFAVTSAAGAALTHYYCPESDMWGRNTLPAPGQSPSGAPLMGEYAARSEDSTHPVFYAKILADNIRRYVPSDSNASASCYLQTSMFGRSDFVTTWDRITPQLRRRRDLGTDSAALSVTTYNEREDTSASTTSAVTESTLRKRFDFVKAAPFMRAKVTWTALDVEVDDIPARQVSQSKE
jgi:hypothetical protein